MPQIESIVQYIIPFFGNKRCQPYGKLLVSDGTQKKVCALKDAPDGSQYITFNRRRYMVRNRGGLYAPKFAIV